MTPQSIPIRTPSLDDVTDDEEIEQELGLVSDDVIIRAQDPYRKYRTYTKLRASAHEFASGMLTDSELNGFGANLLWFDQTLNFEHELD